MLPRRVIVDVDVGTDDYLALLILFRAEKQGTLKIEAICCSNGNTSLDNVCKNVVRLLEIIGRTDVPVFRGAHQQLILPKEEIEVFHGSDGFGDLQHEREPDISIIKDTPSPVAIRELVLKYPKEISLIFVGPLTSLALALKLYPDLAPNVKDLWIMGGNYTGQGNVTASAEYNFFVDPEAVHIVLECMTCPISILPWETCLKSTITFDWRYGNLGIKSPALKLLTRAEKVIYGPSDKIWLPCDAFLTHSFVNPEKNILKQSQHHALIELNSSHTRGQIVIDHLKKKKPNVTIIEDYNEDEFKKIVLEIEGLF